MKTRVANKCLQTSLLQKKTARYQSIKRSITSMHPRRQPAIIEPPEASWMKIIRKADLGAGTSPSCEKESDAPAWS